MIALYLGSGLLAVVGPHLDEKHCGKGMDRPPPDFPHRRALLREVRTLPQVEPHTSIAFVYYAKASLGLTSVVT